MHHFLLFFLNSFPSLFAFTFFFFSLPFFPLLSFSSRSSRLLRSRLRSSSRSRCLRSSSRLRCSRYLLSSSRRLSSRDRDLERLRSLLSSLLSLLRDFFLGDDDLLLLSAGGC